MLVLDIAHDLFDQVLDGDEPLGAEIFIEHDREMHPFLAHIGQQIERAARHWHV